MEIHSRASAWASHAHTVCQLDDPCIFCVIIILFFSQRHFFQLDLGTPNLSIASVRVKLSMASTDCIDEEATLYLYLLRNPSEDITTGTLFAGSEDIEDWLDNVTYELLCGPISVKPYIDISEQSLVINLAHPSLFQCEGRCSLLLCFRDLFVGHYKDVTEKALKSLGGGATEMDTYISTHRRVGGYSHRSRLHRKSPQPAKSAPTNVHSSLHVTVLPYNGSLDRRRRESLLECLFFEDVVFKLLVVACGYCIEERELDGLSDRFQAMVRLHQEKREGEELLIGEMDARRNKALDSLCWIVSIAYCNSDRLEQRMIHCTCQISVMSVMIDY